MEKTINVVNSSIQNEALMGTAPTTGASNEEPRKAQIKARETRKAVSKEVVLKALTTLGNAWSIHTSIETKARGGHRDSIGVIQYTDYKGNLVAEVHVKYSYVVGRLCLSCKLSVSQYPEVCLDQIIAEDEPCCGMRHSYKLNEAKDTIEYWYEGHGPLIYTGNWHHDEKRDIKSMWVEAFIKPEELECLPKKSTCYEESISETVLLLNKAIEALHY